MSHLVLMSGYKRGPTPLAAFTFSFHSATSVATHDGIRSSQESSEAYLHPTYVRCESSFALLSRRVVVADVLGDGQVSYRHSRRSRKIPGNTPFISPPSVRRFASTPTHARTSSARNGHISSRRRCINSKKKASSNALMEGQLDKCLSRLAEGNRTCTVPCICS